MIKLLVHTMKSFLCKIAGLWPITLLNAGFHQTYFHVSFFLTIQKGYSLEQLWKTACICGFSFTRWKLNNLRNPTKLILFRKTIYKTRNIGTGNEMRGMQDMKGMFTRGPVNLLEESEEWYNFRILRNVGKDSAECSRISKKFWRRSLKILKKIPGKVEKDFR